jgi:hypothetical protein
MPNVQPQVDSPSIGNYYVGRGIVYTQLVGESAYHDIGNVTEFTFQVEPTLLDHYSSRVGVQTKDLVVVTRLGATVTMKMEEFTARNLALAFLGSQADSPTHTETVDALSIPLYQGALKFVGTNVVGPQWQGVFPLVTFTPAAVVNLIAAGSGAWGELSIRGDVLKDPTTGQFAIWTATDFVGA